MNADKTETMRFKWIAEGCTTWDEIIARLKQRIAEIEKLRDQGAQIVENSEDYIYYTP